jgi:alpha-beta hydrolase superfamily lysophospholipase
MLKRLRTNLGVLVLASAILTHGAQAAPLEQGVAVTTVDHVAIRGTFYAAEKPGPGVLLIHMCRADADRATWSAVARTLAESGVHTLTIDLRGYGQSAGNEPPFTTMANFISFWRTTGMHDIDAGMDFLTDQPGVDAEVIGFGGASCGVFLGIEAAVRYPNIVALALLSGPFDAEAASQLVGLGDVPILGAASEGDGRAYDAMKRVFQLTPHPGSRNIQYKGDAHGTDMFRTAAGLQQEITDWFGFWLLQ